MKKSYVLTNEVKGDQESGREKKKKRGKKKKTVEENNLELSFPP